jgi:rRNA maturation RNase YbeY
MALGELMTQINYITQNATMPEFDQDMVKEWIVKVAELHGKNVGTLTYVFCDDEYILKVNLEFLKHDYYTDIITFDYSTRHRIAGDMVISLDTVRTNAEQVGAEYRTELMRVVIHGVLHLCGINDKGPGEREIMEQHENEALAILPKNVFEK